MAMFPQSDLSKPREISVKGASPLYTSTTVITIKIHHRDGDHTHPVHFPSLSSLLSFISLLSLLSIRYKSKHQDVEKRSVDGGEEDEE